MKEKIFGSILEKMLTIGHILKDLRFATFSFDLTCQHLNISNHCMQWYIKHCKRIAPYVKFYKKQIEYYNFTAYDILENETGLILPTFDKGKKRFSATILGRIASNVIGLAFEGIF